MKCRVYLCSALFAFLGLFVGSFIINQRNNVFAVSGTYVGSLDFSDCFYNYYDSNDDMNYLVFRSLNNPNFDEDDYENHPDLYDDLCTTQFFLSPSDYFVPNFSLQDNSFNFAFDFSFAHDQVGSTSSTTFNSDASLISYLSSLRSDESSITPVCFLEYIDPLNESLCSFSIENYSSYLPSVTFDFYTISSGVLPSGSISISQNGTYDVSSYSEAIVNIPESIIYGDYHDDLLQINHSIIIGCAVILCIYFFYCIYRMLLKGRE